MKSQILESAIEYAFNAPVPSGRVVGRENLLIAMDTKLTSSHGISIVGGSGSGKTTLLHQFAASKPDSCISLFFSAEGEWGFEPKVVVESLLQQSKIILGEAPDVPENFSDCKASLNKTICAIGRLARRKMIYLVIDNLQQIKESKGFAYKELEELIPFGKPGLKFVFGGETDVAKRHEYPNIELIPFTLSEMKDALGGLGISNEDEQSLYKITKGNPFHVSRVRNVLLASEDRHSAIQNLPDHIPQLFEREWSTIDADDVTLRALAVLASEYSLDSLGKLEAILQVTSDELKRRLDPIGFLLPRQGRGYAFVHSTYRDFCRTKLKYLEPSIVSSLANFFILNADQLTDPSLLKRLLESGHRSSELTAVVSEKVLLEVAGRTKTLARPLALLSVLSLHALNNGQFVDSLRFNLSKSIIRSAVDTTYRARVVSMLIALKKDETAIQLAQEASYAEHRLQLLVAAAKNIKERGDSAEEALLSQINDLVKEVPQETIREVFGKIAPELASISPELGIALLDRLPKTEQAEKFRKQARDWFAFQQWIDNPIEIGEAPPTSKEAIEGIEETDLHRFWTVLSAQLAEFPSKKVQGFAWTLSDTNRSFEILSIWCESNTSTPEVFEIVSASLQRLLTSPTVTPNSRLLRRFAEPLAIANLPQEGLEAFRKLKLVKSQVSQQSASVDHVRLLMLMAQAEILNGSIELGDDLIVEAYLHVSEISDLPIRTESFAYFLAMIHYIYNNGTRIPSFDSSTTLEQEFSRLYSLLLAHTADHVEAALNPILAICETHSQMVLEMIRMLNTTRRRDIVRKHLVIKWVSGEDVTCVYPIREVVLAIESRNYKVLAIRDFIDLLLNMPTRTDNRCDLALTVRDLLPDVRPAGERLHLKLRLAGLMNMWGYPVDSLLVSETEIRDILSSLPDDESSLSARLHLAETYGRLGQTDIAMQYLESASSISNSTVLAWPKENATILNLCRLHQSFVRHNNDLPYETVLVDFLSICESISSLSTRLEAVSELAEIFILAGKLADANKLICTHGFPAFESLLCSDEAYAHEALCLLGPSLFYTNISYLRNRLRLLPCHEDRDDVVRNIVSFVFRRAPTWQPIKREAFGTPLLPTGEIDAIMELMNFITDDRLLSTTMKQLIHSLIEGSPSRLRVTRERRALIVAQLSQMIDDKLPQEGSIQHKGYKIICQSLILRLQLGEDEARLKTDWELLKREAKNILNSSDRVLVLAELSSNLDTKTKWQRAIKKELIDMARNGLGAIESYAERIDRTAFIVDVLRRQGESQAAKHLLRSAFTEIHYVSSSELPHRSTRRLLNLAYAVDEENLDQYIELVDSDPLRIKTRTIASDLAKSRKLADTICDLKNSETAGLSMEASIDAYWDIIGKLNGARIRVPPIESLGAIYFNASKLPLNRCFPAFALGVEITGRAASNGRREAMGAFEGFMKSLKAAKGLYETLRQDAREGARRSIAANTTTSSALDAGLPNNLSGCLEKGRFVKEIKAMLQRINPTELWIIDPYFDQNDLESLEWIKDSCDNVFVSILISGLRAEEYVGEGGYSDLFRSAWLKRRDDSPPDTRITVIEGLKKANDFPIHDRWWLAREGGIRMGTSIRSLGGERLTEISYMTSSEATRVLEQSLKYFGRERSVKGYKIDYNTFSL